MDVNCGNSGDIRANDQRNWIGDISSTLFSLIDPTNKTQHINANEESNIQPIPYGTARLSRSEFSYSFPVTNSQKFVRLFFYLSSYGDLLHSDSLFSVKAGKHTLLKDFNASLYAGVASDGTISREYCINVDAGQLNISFMPNQSHPNAYAFINGIEVVSMPTFLYYTNPDDQNAMILDGQTQQFGVNNDSALETVYRINVGGRQIPPENDTGIDDRNYFAPDDVYKTARNYGMNEKSKFNVTWEFQVDSVFYYMVRLHFCEFEEKIQNAGDRVFQIFINDVLVEALADVMLWTQNQILVPVHRDYTVWMPNSGSFKNLSIKLQPHPTTRSSYRDVLLNDEIRAATCNFDDIFIVGVGGFGNVYKGYIDNGTVPVAIIRLKQGSQQGLHEF
ncbi:hypothetical protein K1719_028312 [Acacia pycnantha]|nr:hypothetical protein K1719_028312 [Acacia pycnantha]